MVYRVLNKESVFLIITMTATGESPSLSEKEITFALTYHKE